MYRCFSLLMGVWKDSKTFVLGYAIYVSNAYMVPFQAFCSLVTQWLRCIVGNLGTTLEKLVEHWTPITQLDPLWTESIQQNQRYHFFPTMHSSSLLLLYPQRNLPLSDITEGKL